MGSKNLLLLFLYLAQLRVLLTSNLPLCRLHQSEVPDTALRLHPQRTSPQHSSETSGPGVFRHSLLWHERPLYSPPTHASIPITALLQYLCGAAGTICGHYTQFRKPRASIRTLGRPSKPRGQCPYRGIGNKRQRVLDKTGQGSRRQPMPNSCANDSKTKRSGPSPRIISRTFRFLLTILNALSKVRKSFRI